MFSHAAVPLAMQGHAKHVPQVRRPGSESAPGGKRAGAAELSPTNPSFATHASAKDGDTKHVSNPLMAALAAAKRGTSDADMQHGQHQPAPSHAEASKDISVSGMGLKRARSGGAAGAEAPAASGAAVSRPSASAAAAFASKGRGSKRSKMADLAGMQSQESDEGGGADNTDMQETALIRMMNTMMVRFDF